MAVLYDLLNGPTVSPAESALRIVEDAPEKQEVA